MSNNFYQQFLTNPEKIPVDLSTGNPVEFIDINNQIFKNLAKIDKKHINLSGYQEYFGTNSFISFIIDKFNKKYKLKYEEKNILVTSGIQSSLRYLHNIAKSQNKTIFLPFRIEFPGAYPIDEIVMNEQVLNYCIDKKGNFFTDIQQLDNINFSNISFVILSIPHNPTGVIFDKIFLEKIYSKVVKNDSYLVIDHTYDIPFIRQSKNTVEHKIFFRKNILNIYSLSKFGLASERIAFVIGDSELVEKIKEQQIKNIIQSPKIGQFLSQKLIEYFSKNKSILGKVSNYYDDRWKILKEELISFKEKFPNLEINTLSRGGGPFFLF